MDLNLWTNNNYKHLLLSSRNITQNNDLSEELLHYSLEQLLEKPNLQEILDSGGANFYLVRIMLNSWRSTTSPFYKIYRGSQSNPDNYIFKDEEYVDNLENVDYIQQELSQLHWYDRELFKIYINENHSVSSLSRATGIPRTSVSLTINRVRNYLKEKIKERKNE
jgi:DNA-directed RNA polymerase specialized sigma24 family protein